MSKRLRQLLCMVWLLLGTLPVIAEVLKNEDVLSLARAGFPETTILKKIQSSETAFDTSVAAIVALREAKVPDAVIEAMLVGNPSKSAAVTTSTIPASSAPVRETGPAGVPQPGRNFVHTVLGVEMIWVQPGEFMMGGVIQQLAGSSASMPLTKVRLTRGYWVAKTEVTQSQWRKIMGSGQDQLTRRVTGGWIDTLRLQTQVGDELPAFAIPQSEAGRFCGKINEQEKSASRLPEGYCYQLPTEAQWEYAARAGSDEHKDHGTNHRSWNDAWIAAYGEQAWFWANSPKGGKGFSAYPLLQPVGTKKANAWGIHDMQGSVGEWCRDIGTDKLPGATVVDPIWTASSRNAVKNSAICRGGSAFEHAMNCAVFFRMPVDPAEFGYGYGMRLALTPN